MTNNPITLKGKQYTVSDETTYEMLPGKVYRDSEGLNVHLSQMGLTEYLANNGVWLFKHIRFPLRELIPVPESKVREIENRYLAGIKNNAPKAAMVALRNDIKEALQASHLRIHNVDGSVSEWEYYKPDDIYPWRRTDISQPDGYTATNCFVQDKLQLAFMRGSTVEEVE